ncbi:DUF7283 family protein [Halosimplex salinum]|uniref:DUF7283 family protein n=1 Tax=Halosimplex salinum TaxID=1710538 RepID=UPI000F46F46D|nr:hypothetical protein [Halosimplex salinum]
MFDTAVESTYVWLALVVVSAGIMGLALRVPTAPPPDATPVARTVDSVASSPHEATARHPVDARQIRLGSTRLGLRGPGGDAHATFTYGPVVPAKGGDGDRLEAVLDGVPPERVFRNSAAFERAVNRSQTREPSWEPAPETLVVRRVTWGGVDATLVGA